MEVVDIHGRASEVEFRLRLDTVEVWHSEHCCGVLDRDLLREWLALPNGAFAVDEIRLTGGFGTQVAMSVPGLSMWRLAGGTLDRLRQEV
jgi:hypothetical protein